MGVIYVRLHVHEVTNCSQNEQQNHFDPSPRMGCFFAFLIEENALLEGVEVLEQFIFFLMILAAVLSLQVFAQLLRVFNHRVLHLKLLVEDEGPEIAVCIVEEVHHPAPEHDGQV